MGFDFYLCDFGGCYSCYNLPVTVKGQVMPKRQVPTRMLGAAGAGTILIRRLSDVADMGLAAISGTAANQDGPWKQRRW